jgi:hypothetical protein
VQVNKGLPLRVLESADGSPWRILPENVHARDAAANVKPQFEASRDAWLGWPKAFRQHRNWFGDRHDYLTFN